MAVVREIERSPDVSHGLHGTTTRCRAYIVQAVDGRRLIQLDTYGSRSRKYPDKVSQTIQFDRTAIVQFLELIEDVFPDLRR